MTIKGSLYWSIPVLKRYSAAKTVVKTGPQIGGFSGILNIIIVTLTQNDVF